MGPGPTLKQHRPSPSRGPRGHRSGRPAAGAGRPRRHLAAHCRHGETEAGGRDHWSPVHAPNRSSPGEVSLHHSSHGGAFWASVSPSVQTAAASQHPGHFGLLSISDSGNQRPRSAAPPLLLSWRTPEGGPSHGGPGTGWHGRGPRGECRPASQVRAWPEGARGRRDRPGEGLPPRHQPGEAHRVGVPEGPRHPRRCSGLEASRPIRPDTRSAQARRPGTALGGAPETDLSKTSAGGRGQDGPRCHRRRVTQEELSPLLAQGSPPPHQHLEGVQGQGRGGAGARGGQA